MELLTRLSFALDRDARPRVYFLQPSNSRLSESYRNKATELGVAVFRHVICDNVGGQLGTDDVIMGKGILVNRDVYPDNTEQITENVAGEDPDTLVIPSSNPPPPPPPPHY